MESRRHNAKPGFTLIELLVVVAVIALLIAILLPTLARARDATRDVLCAGKLSQMMVGWEITMTEGQGRIPDTFPPVSPYEPWYEVMEAAVRTGSSAIWSGSTDRSMLVCPVISNRFGNVGFTSPYYGYAINPRWRPNWVTTNPNDFLGSNEGVRWSDVRSPSRYPWFTDPFVIPATLGAKQYFAGTSVSDWDIGFYHSNLTSRVAFADGHVEGVDPEIFNDASDLAGVPMWFFDAP